MSVSAGDPLLQECNGSPDSLLRPACLR